MALWAECTQLNGLWRSSAWRLSSMCKNCPAFEIIVDVARRSKAPFALDLGSARVAGSDNGAITFEAPAFDTLGLWQGLGIDIA